MRVPHTARFGDYHTSIEIGESNPAFGPLFRTDVPSCKPGTRAKKLLSSRRTHIRQGWRHRPGLAPSPFRSNCIVDDGKRREAVRLDGAIVVDPGLEHKPGLVFGDDACWDDCETRFGVTSNHARLSSDTSRDIVSGQGLVGVTTKPVIVSGLTIQDQCRS
jgi:hypothetical protein